MYVNKETWIESNEIIIIWTITWYEYVIWLCDYMHYSLWVWLWLWSCWLNRMVTFRYIWVSRYDKYISERVSRFDIYIRSGVTFQPHILDHVSRPHTLTIWRWFPWEDHLRLLHSYLLVIDIEKLKIAHKMIIKLRIMYVCLLCCSYMRIFCLL